MHFLLSPKEHVKVFFQTFTSNVQPEKDRVSRKRNSLHGAMHVSLYAIRTARRKLVKGNISQCVLRSGLFHWAMTSLANTQNN